ncbi:5'-AMP-activated protein kinase catalytic subunit alpha-1, partial [Intoshia linei]
NITEKLTSIIHTSSIKSVDLLVNYTYSDQNLENILLVCTKIIVENDISRTQHWFINNTKCESVKREDEISNALFIRSKSVKEFKELWRLYSCVISENSIETWRIYTVVAMISSSLREYVAGGELFDYLTTKKPNENEARKLFQQLISGVHYCHEHMIVHRDLKPENILLDENCNVKIADFGLSNIMQDGDFLKTSCGSPNYAPPEIISGKSYVGPEVDIWSSGVILYALHVGKLPFDDEHIPTMFHKIKNADYTIPSDIDKDVASLIRKMLTVDPIDRIKIPAIRKSDWFMKFLDPNLFDFTESELNLPSYWAITKVAEKYKTTELEVRNKLMANDPEEPICVAYNFILENTVNQAGMDCSKYFYVASSPIAPFKDFFNSPKPHPDRFFTDTTHVSTSSKQLDRKQKWHLGIRSQNKPVDIMTEVYKALKVLNYEWKIMNNFHIRVRRKNEKSKSFDKIALQLYQADKSSYLLDFKSLDTPVHPDAKRVELMTQKSMLQESPVDNISSFNFDVVSTSTNTSKLPGIRSSCTTLAFLEMCSDIIITLGTT